MEGLDKSFFNMNPMTVEREAKWDDIQFQKMDRYEIPTRGFLIYEGKKGDDLVAVPYEGHAETLFATR